MQVNIANPKQIPKISNRTLLPRKLSQADADGNVIKSRRGGRVFCHVRRHFGKSAIGNNNQNVYLDSISPRRVAHAQRFPFVVLPGVWDSLISRRWALGARGGALQGRAHSSRPRRAAAAVVFMLVRFFSAPAAPEGHVQQPLTAGGQRGVGKPVG